MKVCTARAISNIPLLRHKRFESNDVQSQSLYKSPLLPRQFSTGLRSYGILSRRSAISDEKASDTTYYMKDPEHDRGQVMEDTEYTEMKRDDGSPSEASEEGSWLDSSKQLVKFFEDFDIKDLKLDYEEIYSILVFGGGGVVALWLAASIVNAIDSIPLFPKALELVGLGYTFWFSSRYLIFKKNRVELLNKIEEIKLKVLGSEDD